MKVNLFGAQVMSGSALQRADDKPLARKINFFFIVMRPETLVNYLAVAAGSALGGMLRYYLNESALSRLAAPFPAVTFLINLTGSFALGLFLTLAAERIDVSPQLRLAVAVGFLGAYTTFSTFEFETLQLVTGRKLILAALYVVFSVAIGFAAVWGGCATARTFKKAPIAEAHEGSKVGM